MIVNSVVVMQVVCSIVSFLVWVGIDCGWIVLVTKLFVILIREWVMLVVEWREWECWICSRIILVVVIAKLFVIGNVVQHYSCLFVESLKPIWCCCNLSLVLTMPPLPSIIIIVCSIEQCFHYVVYWWWCLVVSICIVYVWLIVC